MNTINLYHTDFVRRRRKHTRFRYYLKPMNVLNTTESWSFPGVLNIWHTYDMDTSICIHINDFPTNKLKHHYKEARSHQHGLYIEHTLNNTFYHRKRTRKDVFQGMCCQSTHHFIDEEFRCLSDLDFYEVLIPYFTQFSLPKGFIIKLHCKEQNLPAYRNFFTNLFFSDIGLALPVEYTIILSCYTYK